MGERDPKFRSPPPCFQNQRVFARCEGTCLPSLLQVTGSAVSPGFPFLCLPPKKFPLPPQKTQLPPAALKEFLSRCPLGCAGMVGAWMRLFHTHRSVFAPLRFLTSSRIYQDSAEFEFWVTDRESAALSLCRSSDPQPWLSSQCVSVFLPLKNLAELG